MPNHVTCELKVTDGLERLSPLDFLAAEAPVEGTDKFAVVDFNRVIPMPPEIHPGGIGHHVETVAGIALGLMRPGADGPPFDLSTLVRRLNLDSANRQLTEGPMAKDLDDADFEAMVQYMRAYRKHGHMTWYDWSIRYWGTKWNAYDAERTFPDTVVFQTAWSAPTPVVEALSRRFPNHTFELRWADEDFGNNVGHQRYKDGEVIEDLSPADGTQGANRLALEITYGGDLPDHMREIQGGDIVYATQYNTYEAEQAANLVHDDVRLRGLPKIRVWQCGELTAWEKLRYIEACKGFVSVDEALAAVLVDPEVVRTSVENDTIHDKIYEYLKAHGMVELPPVRAPELDLDSIPAPEDDHVDPGSGTEAA